MRPVLTRALAEAQPGAHNFLDLQDGFTHFALSGPADRHPVVLLCGLSTPSFIWDDTVPAVVEAGYRVLRYDYFGRGWSERPGGRYDLNRYLGQLEGLITRTLGRRPVTLVGYSWGAGLAAAYARDNPERVRQLILLAPGGLAQSQSLALAVLGLPLLGPALVRSRSRELLRADLRRCFSAPDGHGAFIERVQRQADHSGFLRAYQRTAAHMPRTFAPLYQSLRASPSMVAVLWGEADKKVPLRQFETLSRLLPTAERHVIPGGSHLVQVEMPQVFNEHLLSLLPDPGSYPDAPIVVRGSEPRADPLRHRPDSDRRPSRG